MSDFVSDRGAAVRDLSSIRDFLRWSCTQFEAAGVYFGHGTENAWDEACALVFGALHLSGDNAAYFLDARLTEEERFQLAQLIAQRTEDRTPVPYLVGEAWFARQPYFVNEHVLIPRSPIGELIQQGFSPWLPDVEVSRVLDLCCGSGCIGIATALEMPEAQVDLADISESALAVAARNIERHGVGPRVQVRQGDLFAAVAGERYELILCNPPYVDAADLGSMPAEYRHEPKGALAAGEDGLQFAHRILAEAPGFLSEDGILILEVGNSGAALEQAYPNVPFFWFEFGAGGEGVCLLTAPQLREFREQFLQKAG